MCSTRGGSWGMYITFASTKPTLALNPRGDTTRNPKQGYQCPQKRTCVRQKLFLKKQKKKTLKIYSLNREGGGVKYFTLNDKQAKLNGSKG